MATYYSVQRTGLRAIPPDLNHVHETEGKVRIARFQYTATGAEGGTDIVELCTLPPGKVLSLGHESVIAVNSAATVAVGHGEFKNADGTTQAADPNRFGGGYTAASPTRLEGDDGADVSDFNAEKSVVVQALLTGSMSGGDTIEGYVAYTVS